MGLARPNETRTKSLHSQAVVPNNPAPNDGIFGIFAHAMRILRSICSWMVYICDIFADYGIYYKYRRGAFSPWGADMLVSFSVANFRSIGEEVTLNMVASNKLPDHLGHRIQVGDTGVHVLRSAVLYGANAAGKSNIVKAMAVAQGLIRGRSSDRRNTVDPFRFWPGGEARPSSFEFRMLISGRIFAYGFDILNGQIVSEWLATIRGEDEVIVFQRGEDGETALNDGAKKFFQDDATMFHTLAALKGAAAPKGSVIPEPSDWRSRGIAGKYASVNHSMVYERSTCACRRLPRERSHESSISRRGIQAVLLDVPQ